MSKNNKKSFIQQTLEFIPILLVIFVFRSVFFEPYKIPSGSMIPTLMIGDFILVKKFHYGWKVPFTDVFSDPVYLTDPKKPKRGDVIVFKYPGEESLNYIKRVVGVPGDAVEVRDHVVYINDKAIETKPINGKDIMSDMDDEYKYRRFDFYQETLGDNKHIVQYDQGENRSNSMKIVVPKDKYFVMGDNREHSSDSRAWGFVPFENIKGKAILVWFSMIFPWADHPFKFRPHRIGTQIQ